MKIDLTQFCATRDTRKHLFAPFRLNGFIYATDGAIAIRVPDDGSEVAECDPGLLKIESFFNLPDEASFMELPLLPTRENCISCKGNGVVNYEMLDCEECDGEGEFEYGSHTYECKECRGRGEYKSTRKGVSHKCDQCDGSGNKDIQPVCIGNSLLNLKYLVALKKLGNCRISTSGETEKSYFKFDGGHGVVMPCRG